MCTYCLVVGPPFSIYVAFYSFKKEKESFASTFYFYILYLYFLRSCFFPTLILYTT